jgi:hypothetical protein
MLHLESHCIELVAKRKAQRPLAHRDSPGDAFIARGLLARSPWSLRSTSGTLGSSGRAGIESEASQGLPLNRSAFVIAPRRAGRQDVILVMCLALAPLLAGADSGPSTQVHTLRNDLPLLISSQMLGTGPVTFPYESRSSIKIEEVVVRGTDAVAYWKDLGLPSYDGIAGLHYSAGRWWYVSSEFGQFITEEARNKELASAREGVSSWINRAKLGAHDPVSCSGSLEQYQGKTPGLFWTPCGWWDTLHQYLDGFIVDVTFEVDRLSLPGVHFRSIYGARQDTGFFFTMSLDSSKSVNASRATINVWFPYVLEPTYKYTLSVAQLNQPIVATLQNNTLHFTLPAFSVDPHGTFVGEIRMTPLPARAP